MGPVLTRMRRNASANIPADISDFPNRSYPFKKCGVRLFWRILEAQQEHDNVERRLVISPVVELASPGAIPGWAFVRTGTSEFQFQFLMAFDRHQKALSAPTTNCFFQRLN